MERTYFVIDLKTFYASVECVMRGLDPFSTNLVVADPTRGGGSICLAVSPAMKAQGVRNRCRVFEIPKDMEYITAMPRMNLYIKFSSEIYAIYLKFLAKEDIHVYSIDEAFLDVTHYLKMYGMSKEELAQKIIDEVRIQTGITATCGIGTNMYLAKIALDILAKHDKTNIAYLNEEIYKERLWKHRPLTDFWQVGRGTVKRLEANGFYYMEDIAKGNEQLLYKLFGINAEYLIDHAWGREPCTIKQIKNYKSQSNSVSSGQVLFEDYPYEKALLVVKEMVELTCLDLTSKHLVSSSISLYIGYSKDAHNPTGGSMKLTNTTNSFHLLLPYFIELFEKTTLKTVPIRKISISFNEVIDEMYEQYDLFTDVEEAKKDAKLQKAIVDIKKKYGKGAIIRGMNLEEGATTIKRHKLVGGHNGG